jgi:hypothetical protein
MKKLLNALYEIGLSIGQARAASALARAGHIAEAKELMTKN